MVRTYLTAHGVDLVIIEASEEDLRAIGADGTFGWRSANVICVPACSERDDGHVWKSFGLPLYAGATKEEVLAMIEADAPSKTTVFDQDEIARVSSFREPC